MVEVKDEFGRTKLVPFDEANMEDEEIEPEAEIRNVEHFDASKERRNMGVGFYQLSQDEKVRQSQLEELKSLRDDTITSRTKTTLAQQDRAAKLQERKNLIAERAKKRKLAAVDQFLDSL
jgi:hypothetical protein